MLRPYRLCFHPTANAFTQSNASAALVNRRVANSASMSRKNESRSASLAKPIATPFSLSGAAVAVTRNSLTLSPRNPGNVVQPSW